MSNITEKLITFAGSGIDVSGNSLGMYQENIEADLMYPSFADINQMIAYAKTGKSAFNVLQSNPYAKIVGDNVEISLEFFTRPYPLGLAYSLSLNVGTIGAPQIVQKEYINTIVVPMSDTVIFPTNVLVSSLEWSSPSYDSDGSVVSNPSYSVVEDRLVLSKAVFAILKITYSLTEHKFPVSIVIPKTETENIQGVSTTTDYSITGLTSIVTGKFNNADGEEQVESLTLKYPQIISDFLEACPEDGSLTVDWGSSTIGDPFYTTYYYSTCTGEILYTHRVGH